MIEQVGGSRTNFKCEEKDKIFSKTTDSFSFCGDFKSLVITLVRENAHDPMPIIDKSGYIGDICVDIKGKLNDIELVKLMLQQYGFKMTEQEIEVNMLVMKDRS